MKSTFSSIFLPTSKEISEAVLISKETPLLLKASESISYKCLNLSLFMNELTTNHAFILTSNLIVSRKNVSF